MNKEGIIKNYDPQKQYGFVFEKTTGDTHFFHLSSINKNPEEVDVQKGMSVEFISTLEAKGWKIQKMNIVKSFPLVEIFKPKEGMYVSNTTNIPAGTSIAVNHSSSPFESRNPSEAKELLITRARGLGYNAVLNYRVTKRTGTSWSNSNYKYTIHRASGNFCLLTKSTFTLDEEKSKEYEQILMDRKNSLLNLESGTKVHDAGMLHAIIPMIVLGVLAIIIFG
jgi:cold shock CspA family protein